MEPFSVPQIVEQRRAFDKLGFEPLPVIHRGIEYPCVVIPADWEQAPKALPNFAFRMTPTKAVIRAAKSPVDVTLFAVSSSVPQHFQPFWLAHEIEEFVTLGINAKNRCKRAATQELIFARGILTATDLRAYVELRRKLFVDLITYGTEQGWDEDDLGHFAESLGVIEAALFE